MSTANDQLPAVTTTLVIQPRNIPHPTDRRNTIRVYDVYKDGIVIQKALLAAMVYRAYGINPKDIGI